MNLDNQTLIHVAAEVTLIAGLGFWMKKRADASDAKIEELEAKMKKYEEVIMQQQNLIARHESMLRQVFGQPELRQPEKSLPPQQTSAVVQKEPEEPAEDIDDILKQELAREDEKSIEIETADSEIPEKKASPTALKQRKVKKKTENVRKT